MQLPTALASLLLALLTPSLTTALPQNSYGPDDYDVEDYAVVASFPQCCPKLDLTAPYKNVNQQKAVKKACFNSEEWHQCYTKAKQNSQPSGTNSANNQGSKWDDPELYKTNDAESEDLKAAFPHKKAASDKPAN